MLAAESKRQIPGLTLTDARVNIYMPRGGLMHTEYLIMHLIINQRNTMNISSTSQEATRVLTLEANALLALAEQIPADFPSICEQIIRDQKRVIIMGVGKSGHIAQKIASTLASTGTPSFSIHPTEALHGDIGNILASDLLLLISYSGESTELLTLLPALKHIGVKTVALTGNSTSSLAKGTDYLLALPKLKEACPHDLAPTTSTTATLALGDALAITLLKLRHFEPSDFALNHPGGTLGKRLTLSVSDIMLPLNSLPIVAPGTSIADAILIISEKRKGLGLVAAPDNKLLGLYTDGDLRRTLEKNQHINDTIIDDEMTTTFQKATPDMLAIDALQLLAEKRMHALPILNEDDHLIGLIHLDDILRTGLML